MSSNMSLRMKFGMWRMKVVHSILRLVPKQKRLVLCTAWFGQKYIDNTKYVYEYLLEHSDYKLCWMTNNRKIYDTLRKEGKPVAMFNSLKGYIKQVRAQAVFSTVQFSDYNQWLLTDTIFIDLGHGHPIKDPGKAFLQEPLLSFQKFKLNNVHYYGIKASDFAKEKHQDVVPVDPSHIFISDFARNDVFIDASLREGKNQIVEDYKKGRKAIVYMPTHRSDGKDPMDLKRILPLDEIQNFCLKNNYVFIIKKHFYHRNEVMDLSQYNSIFDITNVDDIDPQVLLYQSDVLISDYSACYIDFLLLNRPLMFYQYDLNEYQKKERSIYIPFETLDIAPIAYSESDFIEKLSIACEPEDRYESKRQEFTPHYFKNTTQGNGREKVKIILDQLMQKYYSK